MPNSTKNRGTWCSRTVHQLAKMLQCKPSEIIDRVDALLDAEAELEEYEINQDLKPKSNVRQADWALPENPDDEP